MQEPIDSESQNEKKQIQAEQKLSAPILGFTVVKTLYETEGAAVFHVSKEPGGDAVAKVASSERLMAQLENEIALLTGPLAECLVVPKVLAWGQMMDKRWAMVISPLGGCLAHMTLSLSKAELTSNVTNLLAAMLKITAEIRQCGVVHGDIKPQNFIVTSGASFKLYLIDFGIARLASQLPSDENLGTMTRAFATPAMCYGLPPTYDDDEAAAYMSAYAMALGVPEYHKQYDLLPPCWDDLCKGLLAHGITVPERLRQRWVEPSEAEVFAGWGIDKSTESTTTA